MSKTLDLHLLHDLIPGGIDYGSIVLVEFQVQSSWSDIAYTIAAQALRIGAKVDLHVFQQSPKAAHDRLVEMGFDVARLLRDDRLRLIDSYSVQVGVGKVDPPGYADASRTQSVRMEDWARAAGAELTRTIPDSDRQRIHIDDNAAVVTRYNSEDATIDAWRTRLVPLFKARETTLFNAVATEFASPSFYPQLEAMSEAILDCRAEEGRGGIEQLFRVRSFRGKSPESRWQVVRVSNHEASLTPRAGTLPSPGVPSPRVADAKDAKPDVTHELVAIVFTDMVDSTRLSGLDERLAIAFRDEQREVLRDAASKFHARIIRTIGDGSLLAFTSVLAAAQWALEVQQILSKRSQRRSGSEALQLRIGIHVGEVLVEGADIAGHGVDVASRIEPLANPGGICLSRPAYDQIRNAPEFHFESLGPVELKGVEAPVEVLRLLAGPGSSTERQPT